MRGDEQTPHISVTQIEMYRRCPAQYYFRYVRGMKIRPAMSMAVGSAVHTAAEVTLTAKRDEGTIIKPAEAAEIAVTDLESRLDEVMPEPEYPVGKAKDDTARGAATYAQELLPAIEPRLVESKIELEIAGVGVPLIGYCDVLDEHEVVRDLKTVRRTPAEDVAVKSLQLGVYAHALKQAGEPVRAVAIDALVILNRDIKVVQSVVRATLAITERAIATVQRVAAAIESGAFWPNDQSFMCSPGRCGYWDICHDEFGGVA